MGIPPFNSSRRAGSNGSIFVLLRPLDAKIDLNGIWDGMGWDGLGRDGILNGWQV